jgi:hypothetical protein
MILLHLKHHLAVYLLQSGTRVVQTVIVAGGGGGGSDRAGGGGAGGLRNIELNAQGTCIQLLLDQVELDQQLFQLVQEVHQELLQVFQALLLQEVVEVVQEELV